MNNRGVDHAQFGRPAGSERVHALLGEVEPIERSVDRQDEECRVAICDVVTCAAFGEFQPVTAFTPPM